jgi:hypothetical protein
MAVSCHILVEQNPVVIYASRNGHPDKVIRLLQPFLEKFADERETAGQFSDTPECLAAQVIVRLGFEICEDDFSNLKVGLTYYSDVDYLYVIDQSFKISVWQPTPAYRQNPAVGLEGCAALPQPA